MEPLLKVDSVSFRYGQREVLRDISFEARSGDFIGLIGPNGSGKTTLLNVIDGAVSPSRGSVYIEGKDVSRLKRNELARRVAVVAQENQLTFSFSAFEVVLMGRFPYLDGFGFETEHDHQICRRAMELTETTDFADRPIHELSGGERQRVFIARAIAQEPDLILFDEPTSFLDLKHQVQFFDLIQELNEQSGLSVITVSHDINMAAAYCHELILLDGGRIHKKGRPTDVVTEEAISQVYGERVLVDTSPVNAAPRVTLAGKKWRKEQERDDAKLRTVR